MSISVAIVIPIYREGSYIEKTLDSIEKSVQYSIEKKWTPYVVLVVNNPISISEEFRLENQRLIPYLNDFKTELSYPIDILDYTLPGLQNGVGEARRNGIAYAMSRYLRYPKDRIVSLDADCLVDRNYISAIFSNEFIGSAFTIYFEHPLESESIVMYELYLRYLRWGLIKAQSPHAYYSIGSCLGTDVQHYNKVGGMPNKSATEDFHFLNKLRRVGFIDYWTDTKVMPSSRFSERVTLGTGYFLTHAKTGLEKVFSKLLIPSPQDFETLRKILLIFRSYNGQHSLKEQFDQIGMPALYTELHRQKVIEKIHSILETTAKRGVYQSRLMEVIDALETLRMLRFMSPPDEKNTTPELFMTYAKDLWSFNDANPKDLLLRVRAFETKS